MTLVTHRFCRAQITTSNLGKISFGSHLADFSVTNFSYLTMTTQNTQNSQNSEKTVSKAENLHFLQQKSLEIEFKLEGSPYKPVQNIGIGAYGVVCSAIDCRTDRKVAIKKIPNAFAAVTLVKRTLREVRILKNFRHENIVAILDMFQARGTHGLDVYMVMDLMESDLHQIIHSKQPLTEQHLQYFLYQILRGLKYIHSAGVIHRDLKPSNLLINADCLLKIGDFGMARSFSQEPEGQSPLMTQYVATRWYRAPELLFSMLDYSAAMDIWSVGCIFAEMIMRRQLFPGKDHMSQLKLIIFYLGTPPREVMDRISSDLVKRIIGSLGWREPLPWNSILPRATPPALDLVGKMMRLEPWLRVSAAEALKHDYLDLFHDPETEPSCSKEVLLETDTLELLNPEELKAALAEQAIRYSSFQNSQTFSNPEQKKQSSSDFLSEANKPHKQDDVVMLSAKFEEQVAIGGKNPEETVDVKSKLRNALQAKAAAKQATNEMNTVVQTAHTRHLERQEKRRKRSERQESKATEQQAESVRTKLSDQDQSLLDRWSKMQHETEQKRLEGQIGDIISQNLPSPVASTSTKGTVVDRGLDGVSARNSKQLDSAQLMDTWLQATNMDPEELQDLEKEIRMVTP